MNKKTLIEAIAGSDISLAQAEKALDATLKAITETLRKGDKLTLVGFGTFSVQKRSAKKGRNPKTGAEIHIPGKTVAKFKAGTKLIEDIN